MAISAAQIALNISATMISALDIGTVSYPLNYAPATNFTTGTGANQFDTVYTKTRTLTASATENLDLAGGLTSAFGATLTFTKIKGILVVASTANTNAVQVQRASSNGVPLFMAASDGVALTPGGMMLLTFPDSTGVAVTAGTGDILTVTNSAGSTSVTYDIVILGCA